MLIIFFTVMISIGFFCKKNATDVSGFVLGGRNVGALLTAFAYGTSYFSAVIFIGYAGQFGWRFGISSTWIGIGNAILGSLLAWMVLGKRTRVMTHTLSSKTMPEFFGKRYDSKKLKLVASAIVFIFLIPYTASLYNGLSRLFSMAFTIDYAWCVIGMAVFTGLYVTAGGYLATAINDFIQGIIMLVGIVAVIISVLSGFGGFSEALKQLSEISDSASNITKGSLVSTFGPAPFELLSVVILTSLGTWGLPQMIQKFYAIKDEKAIKTGTVVSTLFALVVAGGCYFLGGFGRISGIQTLTDGTPLGGYDSIIPTMLEPLNEILIGVVIVLVLSASMSTLSSLVLASSSTLTLDFIDNITKEKMSENKKISTLRTLIVVFIAISAIIAIIQYKANISFIAQLMGISWGALAGAFLSPFLYGLYFKWVTRASVWVSFAFGSGIMILNMLFRAYFPAILQSPINCGAFAMIGSLIIVPVVSAFTKKPDENTIKKCFADINK